ncbi:hypothetical protein PFMC_05976, partial [Plasmodium falciparum CAMP/Malaysia]
EIDKCKPKTTEKSWQCENRDLVSGKGECMPPRRQTLCVINLQHLSDETPDGLRKAFIQCAAAETFLLWHKYKKDKNGGDADTKLNSGIIPEEFKRQMFYTFGDFRDLCLGTDISARKYPISDVKNKIDNCFNKNGDKGKNDNTERKQWWQKHGHEIWEGMLCALSYDTTHYNVKPETRKKLSEKNDYSNVKFSDESTTLEEFAKRPQFLRWMTEWGDDFCKKRKAELDKLLGNCKDCSVSDSTGGDGGTKTCQTDSPECQKCREQCKKYQEWLKKWRENYDKQKVKFKTDKEGYNDDPDTIQSTEAYEYLSKKLTNITCTSGTTNGDCNCMKEPSKETKKPSDNTDMPASLDNEPEEVKAKC